MGNIGKLSICQVKINLRFTLILIMFFSGFGCVSMDEDSVENGSPDISENNSFGEYQFLELFGETLMEADLARAQSIEDMVNREYAPSRQRSLEARGILNRALMDLEETDTINEEDKKILKSLVEYRQEYCDLIYKTSTLLEEKDRIFSNIGHSENSQILPGMELLWKGYTENSWDWFELSGLLEDSQESSDISQEEIETIKNIGEIQEKFARLIQSRVEELQSENPEYVPVVRREIPREPTGEMHSDLITGELVEFFKTFDGDGDGGLSIGEAQDFFFWMEENIRYRYDFEGEENPFVGTLVGDGRPGPDNRQTPLETFKERAGDCEDMATLEQAFYTYYGIESYVAGINAEDPDKLDHAAAIVRISGHVDDFRNFLGDLGYYQIPEGTRDIYGEPVNPGVYMLVDNAYSNILGSLNGELSPGAFRIHCGIPLNRGYGEEWGEVVDKCGVPMG